jgi:GntR family transcriptional regulator
MNEVFQIPKYFQISKEIIDNIKSGSLKPGDKIPSENELIILYKVSNTTARKVLQQIEKEGWIFKVKGKGTFIKEAPIARSASKVLSFTKNMILSGYKPSTKLLGCEILSKPVTKFISQRNYTLKPPIYKIIRLRYANEIPVLREVRYISMNYCPGIDKFNLEQPLYEIYNNEYGLNIQKIDQLLSAIIINKEQCALFKIKKNSPGILVEGVTFCGNELILELEESVYRGDKYKFSVQAVP